jgi:ABC-type transport system involved in multi-copper enzyme maturation permease subunit
MTTQLSQILGIMRYEMRLQWARRSLLIVGVFFAIITMLFLILITQSADPSQMSRKAVTFSLIFSVSPVCLLLMQLSLPPIVAESIAKDQQFGMNELRDSLPITSGLYLAGKMLGIVAIVMVMMLAIAVFLMIVSLFVLGPLDVGVYLRIWLLGIIPSGLALSMISVLIASRQPNRKRATMVGSLVTVYCLLSLPFSANPDHNWLYAALPSAWTWAVLKMVFDYADLAADNPLSTLAQIPDKFLWQTAVATAVQVLVVWLIVWGWWRYRNSNQ